MMNDRGRDIRERAYAFALTTTKATRKFPRNSEGSVLISQILRAATSIPANLFEGSAGVSKKEFVQFLSVSKKSAVETIFWLRFARDLGLLTEEEYAKLSDECDQIIRILSRIILNAKR